MAVWGEVYTFGSVQPVGLCLFRIQRSFFVRKSRFLSRKRLSFLRTGFALCHLLPERKGVVIDDA